ncbi:MAG: hypothetical protein ACJAR6_000751 [Oleispira sp.]|jgi:hypothetical protein
MGVNIKTLSGDIQAVSKLSLELLSIDLDSSAHKVREDHITDDFFSINIDLRDFRNLTYSGTNNIYFGLQSKTINYTKIRADPQGTAQPRFWLNLQNITTSPGPSLDSLIPQR